MRDAIDTKSKAKKLDTVSKEYNDVIYQNFVETIMMHKYVLEFSIKMKIIYKTNISFFHIFRCLSGP